MKSTKSDQNNSPAVQIVEAGVGHHEQRLDNFLLSKLKGVPKSRIYRIIRKGEVRVNGKRAKPEYKLQSTDMVRIPPVRMSETEKLQPPSAELAELLLNSVLYEDEELLVLNKPSGLPVHGGTGVKTGLIESMRVLKPELTELELVHRLDKGTSGCIVLAKTVTGLRQLTNSFRNKQVKKIYHALVAGKWPERVTSVDAALLKQAAIDGNRMVKVSEKGKSAQTAFRVLRKYPNSTLIEARPSTGRTHQIRVHAQVTGCPLLGDEKYNADSVNEVYRKMGISRLCLHAAELQFSHPVSGKNIIITAPYEKQFTDAMKLLAKAG